MSPLGFLLAGRHCDGHSFGQPSAAAAAATMQLTNCELSLSLILSLITPAASRLTHPAFYSSWKLQLFAQSTHTKAGLMSDCRKSGSLGKQDNVLQERIKWIESVNTGPHCC